MTSSVSLWRDLEISMTGWGLERSFPSLWRSLAAVRGSVLAECWLLTPLWSFPG